MRKQLPTIYGFNGCSEIGPDIFATSIFLAGCNLRCPYCMNSKLINKIPDGLYGIDIEEIKQKTMEKNGEWFMISGGEPTCTDINLLVNLLEEIKSWGLKIGMSTNGTNSDVLREVICYLNYVALDIKTSSPQIYEQIGAEFALTDILISKGILFDEKTKRDDFDYEIRTTLYPEFVNEYVMSEISSIISKKETWVLQNFRHAKNMFGKEAYDIEPYDDNKVKELIEIAKKATSNIILRDV